MLPFQTLISLHRKASTPVYQQIANGLITQIRDGVIQPGSALPGSRQMASILDVHRKTVEAAYQELFIQDWIEVIPRKGVIVSQKLPEIKPRSFKEKAQGNAYGPAAPFSFHHFGIPASYLVKRDNSLLAINDGFPDARIAPLEILLREYRRLARLAASRPALLRGEQSGSFQLRSAITSFLAETRGMSFSADNVLVSRGAQMAIYMAARLLIQPGAEVLVGKPSYFMADEIFRQFGARLIRVPMDDNGMDVDFIGDYCRKKRPALLYIIPHHHHPTTVTLSAERRMKLLQIIRHYQFPVIEDDYDYDFHYSGGPILPLASAGHDGNVIYIGSLTKSLAPSLRVGYMVASQDFVQEASHLRRMIDIRGDNLLEESLAVLFREGDMQRHLKKSVKLYHQRRDLLCSLLERELPDIVSFTKPQGGLALWLKFNEKYPLPGIAARAARNGLTMTDGQMYGSEGEHYNAFRFGFASLNEVEMEKVIARLRLSIS